MQYGHHSERLLAFNANPLLRRWELSTNRIDIKTKFFYHQRFSLYADVYNLTGDNQRERLSSGEVIFLQDRYDPQFHFGIEGRFQPVAPRRSRNQSRHGRPVVRRVARDAG